MQHFGRRPLMAAAAAVGLVATFDLASPPPQPVTSDPEVGIIEPEFSISWHRGHLQMSGHTFSQQHEKDLMHSAEASFTSAPVRSDFEPLGIVPDYWREGTLGLAKVLQGSASGKARISSATVEVNAVTNDVAELEERVASLTANLPGRIEVRASILPIDDEFSVDAACEDEFAQFAAGSIGFEENSSVFRPSAYSRLSRVTALADGCRHASIEITGHTDSSGDSEWNTALSLQRAQAVADFLADAGIAHQRLRVSGVGSVEPLVSNTTRYGRSINRRIEIKFVAD